MSKAEQVLRQVLPENREIRGGTKERWLELRRYGIGASEAAAILGAHPYVSPLAVWASKVKESTDGLEGENEAMKWGRLLEPVIAREASPKAYRWPQTKSVWIKDAPLFTTPDAVAPDAENGCIVIQCKTTAARNAQQWDEGPPVHHVIQVQHELLVTGAKVAILAVLIGGQEYRAYRMEAHEKFQEKLAEALVDWYEQHVVKRRMPDAVRPEDKAILDRLFPRPTKPEPVQLPPELLDVDSELLQLEQEIKRLESRREELRNLIRQAIGEHEAGILPDGTVWEWRTVRRKEYVVPAKEYRQLRRKAPK